jgi:hypothetical protein
VYACAGATAKAEVSAEQRRGAMQVLGMLCRANPESLVSRLDVLVRVGLGSHGKVRLYTEACEAVRWTDAGIGARGGGSVRRIRSWRGTRAWRYSGSTPSSALRKVHMHRKREALDWADEGGARCSLPIAIKTADAGFVRLQPDHPLAARLQEVVLWDVPLPQWSVAPASDRRTHAHIYTYTSPHRLCASASPTPPCSSVAHVPVYVRLWGCGGERSRVPLAEQAIECLYRLMEHPDALATALVRQLTATAFGLAPGESGSSADTSMAANNLNMSVLGSDAGPGCVLPHRLTQRPTQTDRQTGEDV